MARLTAIARELRRMLTLMEVNSEIWFLTTSEAPQVAHEFPVFKIPSKTILRQSEGGQRAYASIAKVLISNIIASFRPDALILDTIPEGSFKEFLFIKDHARRCFFIYRERTEARSRSFQSHLGLYDRILIPESNPSESEPRFPLQGGIRKKTHFIGRVHGFRPETSITRETLIQSLGIPSNKRLVYIAAGGGGDPTASEDLQKILQALDDVPDLFLLIGLGPLYRGLGIHGPDKLSLTTTEISRYFPALDLAISAAGYNTYEELLAARVPSLFFAQKKGLDQQEKRIRMGVARGWHGWLKSLDSSVIRQEVHQAIGDRNPGTARDWRNALSSRPPEYGQSGGAKQILDGISDLSGLDLNRDAIHFFDHALKFNPDHWNSSSEVDTPLLESVAKFAWAWIQERLKENEATDLLAAIRIQSRLNPERSECDIWLSAILSMARNHRDLFLFPPDWRKFLRNFTNDREDPEKTFRILQSGLDRLQAELDTQSLRDLLSWWNQTIHKDLSIPVWQLLQDWIEEIEAPSAREQLSRRVEDALETAKNYVQSIRERSGSNLINPNVEKQNS